ncbi:hypothetical protein WN51_03428 [Melipona quadrifasciata]|uniref:Uncharacterized protein n=1 Tax=Melipona quadrifasciata TaxID=166423 RepID=A0A0M9ABL3_9HYME|nr:hypothetical protein WN51_03428 [Melipona quadrifasciata]
MKDDVDEDDAGALSSTSAPETTISYGKRSITIIDPPPWICQLQGQTRCSINDTKSEDASRSQFADLNDRQFQQFDNAKQQRMQRIRKLRKMFRVEHTLSREDPSYGGHKSCSRCTPLRLKYLPTDKLFFPSYIVNSINIWASKISAKE